jgi:predicted RNA binding protein YcfA (HicA-like mRNA interferase family)
MKATEMVRLIERYARRHSVPYRAEHGKGSHLKLWLGDRRTVVPIHPGAMPIGTYRAILRQLGIKGNLED